MSASNDNRILAGTWSSRTRILIRMLVIGVGLAVTPGCSTAPSSGNRISVSGQVTKGGHPVALASILFTPMEGVSGQGSGGSVQGGRYKIPQESGPTLGKKYTVLVETMPGIPPDDAKPEDIVKSERWTTTVEIPKDGSLELDIEFE